MIANKGYKWYKCDLHLHTTASKCFADESVTAEQWVQACIDKKLTCVAVTDHNSNKGITEIQKAAEEYGLFVFPGVELTCDTSGIHLLVLFDIGKTDREVGDFLAECGIKYKDYGEQEARSPYTIFKVLEIANAHDALVIPAHIDEFNGLADVRHSVLADFYSMKTINAVQVVHKKFVEDDMNGIEEYLSKYYNKTIKKELADSWKKPVSSAKKHNCTLLTFSDNPHEEGSPKHGIAGIGTRFTWIQMDQKPSLEGLRQAFLSPDNRIQNDFNGIDSPFFPKKTVIQSVTLSDTYLNRKEFNIDFHHQLNVIIGGPGSGKSSILRCIRGILKNVKDLNNLPQIQVDQNDFYRKYDSKLKKGIFKDESKICLKLIHEGLEYEVISESINSVEKQKIQVYCIDGERKIEQENPEEFLAFFQIEQYSQKQIYEISKEPSALRDKINSALPDYETLRNELEEYKSSFLSKSAAIRELLSKSYKKNTIKAEIQKIENQIDIFKKSEIEKIIEKENKFRVEYQNIDKCKMLYVQKIDGVAKLKNILQNRNLDLFSDFDEIHAKEFQSLFLPMEMNIEHLVSQMDNALADLTQKMSDISNKIESTIWHREKIENAQSLEELFKTLEDSGIGSAEQVNLLLAEKSEKEQDLQKIASWLVDIDILKKEKQQIQEKYFEKSEHLSKLRKEFVYELKSHNLNIKVNSFRDKISFEKTVGDIINLGSKYEGDFKKLISVCFGCNSNCRRQFEKAYL